MQAKLATDGYTLALENKYQDSMPLASALKILAVNFAPPKEARKRPAMRPLFFGDERKRELLTFQRKVNCAFGARGNHRGALVSCSCFSALASIVEIVGIRGGLLSGGFFRRFGPASFPQFVSVK
ncbi:hypothetical protein OH491_27500 (plasmid) [Termitidicoccus mucosus]|uniref:hypothetical protein n=1 Tax=Termitidicoccus mucosus TaxID=1184151 RepID=UPI00318423B1